jgi:DNA polymerase I-like protein with 3'-5' exonuclease and polymerase domains
MLAAQLVNENRKVGLKSLGGSLLGKEMTSYDKLQHYPGFAKHEILGVPLPLVAEYAMDDTEATWALWHHLEPQLAEEGVDHAFYEIWMPLLLSLQEMESRGIAMNMAGVKEARERYEQIMRDAEIAVWREGVRMVKMLYFGQLFAGEWEKIDETYLKPLSKIDEPYTIIEGENPSVEIRGTTLPLWRKYTKTGAVSKAFSPRIPWFNPASQNQIKDLLFSWLAVPVEDIAETFELRFTGDEAQPIWSADRDNLRVIKHEMGDECPEVIDHLLTYRKASKLISTYLKVYEEKCDAGDHHCLRTNFNQASTDTGRLSSSGPNLQNQPARGEEGRLIRSLFVARPGHKLVVADYSMMELRMAANFSGEPKMINAFREGLDLHSLTAAGQMGMSYAEFVDALEAGDAQAKKARFIGKTSNFGLLYGMGPRKFQKLLLVDAGVKVSLDEAVGLVDDFNKTYATLTEWKRDIERFIQKHGYIDTLRGRKRRLPDVWHGPDWAKKAALRQGVNARIQGSCADIICEVIPPIQDQFLALGGSLLLQVHDELVGELPSSQADLGSKLMSKMMTENTRHMTVPLVAEAGIGDTWGDAK